MIYIETGSTDVYYNFGLENYFATEKRLPDTVFLFWRTTPTLMVGQYQNLLEEINKPYADAHGIHLVRRMSGGGTIYTDLGGWQFTFIEHSPEQQIEFAQYIGPVVDAVRELGADVGFAFDGDADRCLAVDEDGNMVNGDQIMGILARAKKNAGKLNHDTLVVTVMSNLGLKLALRSMGIKTVQTNVDDRYVLEEMLRGDYSLGGEQSGHVINREFATTGDGTLTALTLCNEVVKSGKSLKELAADFPQLPQTLINVPNVDKMAAKTNAKVQAAVEREEKLLGDTGRVLLRPSGTEPLVRVMAEAETQQQADEVCDRLAKVVADELTL